jgi:hypothetical protein
VSSVTFAEVCPSIRCRANTFTPALMAAEAQMWRRSCGVIACTFARLTAVAKPPRRRAGPWQVSAVRSGEHPIAGGLAVALHRQLIEHEGGHRRRAAFASLGGADGVMSAELYGVLRHHQSAFQELDQG